MHYKFTSALTSGLLKNKAERQLKIKLMKDLLKIPKNIKNSFIKFYKRKTRSRKSEEQKYLKISNLRLNQHDFFSQNCSKTNKKR